MRFVAARGVFFWACVALLLLSLNAHELIPSMQPSGIDFQNFWTFHHCVHKDQPYGIAGPECHDAWNRPIVYPPALYWFFAWTRPFAFERALRLWRQVLVLLMLPPLFVGFTTRRARGAAGAVETAAFWLLLLGQFPMAFALERGNCDALVVAVWAVASWFAMRRSSFFSGFFSGIAVALKVYPLFAVAVAGAGMLAAGERRSAGWRIAAFFSLGVFVAVGGAFLVSLHQSELYVTKVLPAFAKQGALPQSVFSHSIPELAEDLHHGKLAFIPTALVIGSWTLASLRHMRHRPELCFAGALACSTYGARTSYDYNLVTTYPLLLVLFVDAVRGTSRSRDTGWVLLGLGLLSVVGDCHFFASPDYVKLHILLQLLWLSLTAAYYAVDGRMVAVIVGRYRALKDAMARSRVSRTSSENTG